jgi:hypothetical protein
MAAEVCCARGVRADVRLFWHPQGDYLAVQVDRFTKTRKSTFTAFELFSVKERDIPMEVRRCMCSLCTLNSCGGISMWLEPLVRRLRAKALVKGVSEYTEAPGKASA